MEAAETAGTAMEAAETAEGRHGSRPRRGTSWKPLRWTRDRHEIPHLAAGSPGTGNQRKPDAPCLYTEGDSQSIALRYTKIKEKG